MENCASKEPAGKRAKKGATMKINIDELTYEEIKEVVDRLREMKLETIIRKSGPSIILQTENGPVQIAESEAEAYGVPAMVF